MGKGKLKGFERCQNPECDAIILHREGQIYTADLKSHCDMPMLYQEATLVEQEIDETLSRRMEREREREEERVMPVVYYCAFTYIAYCLSILGPAYTPGIHQEMIQQEMDQPGSLPRKFKYWHPGLPSPLWLKTVKEEQAFYETYPDAILVPPEEFLFHVHLGTTDAGREKRHA